MTRSRVLPSKCTRRYGAICALCFDTPIELRPGSTITDGDETKKKLDKCGKLEIRFPDVVSGIEWRFIMEGY